ncbi:hypothetical protein DENIS_1210 [Desulfonema ishimotonii]|uniref:Uncharacterized protein n=1 Tax=Desulfonema ishimotonii TaxID=45657 RepID=A0A401FTH0_9BACT|nr:hypothetical protein [Desulfonema ishimotonii]GBC60259.1 hypothetical protein DENIS_1210 [Desulfonema ishimotonii]
MEQIRQAMHKNLIIAMEAFQIMAEKERQAVEKIIREILAVKYHMENLAADRGYSQACRDAIPTCRGECCKWHFPENLTYVDFFIAIYNMPVEKQNELSELILDNRRHQCPVLMKNGCFFSFEQRPVACTNAYPCFNDRSYWEEKEAQSVLIRKAFRAVSEIVPFGSAE